MKIFILIAYINMNTATLSRFLSNKKVLHVVSALSVLCVIGYITMGRTDSIVLYVLISIAIRAFSDNMILVLGVPLIFVNLLLVKGSKEGMTTETEGETKVVKPTNASDNDKDKDTVKSANVGKKEDFEVGRAKNGSVKIDYASTIEDAYDDLNKILGEGGIQNLTQDTKNLMKQQMDLAESMKAMTPLIKNIMPLAKQAQDMMGGMGGGKDMTQVMELAKKMASGLN